MHCHVFCSFLKLLLFDQQKIDLWTHDFEMEGSVGRLTQIRAMIVRGLDEQHTLLNLEGKGERPLYRLHLRSCKIKEMGEEEP